MRIVYLNPCGRLGGAETSLREILASIRATEPAWEIWLVLGEDGPLADHAREIGVKVIVLAFPLALARLGDASNRFWATLASLLRAVWATALYSQRLARTIRRIAPEILHTNGFKMHLLGAWVRPRRTALVWHIHDYVGSRRLMSRLLRRFVKSCTVIIANSRSVASDLRTVFPRAKIVPIYNAVDLDRFTPSGTNLDLDEIAKLPAAARGTVRVGLLATFARWKGHKVFLQAMSRLSSVPLVRGYVIGGPIYQTDGSQWSMRELQEEANRLGLAERVGFTGFLHNAPSAMRSLDILVHASTEPEPFGMVIIEAMACGKPVIASRAGGACELFVDGEDALAHSPGDVEALADQIRRLVGDERLRSSLGRAGRATVETIFHRARLAEELLKVYREIGSHTTEARLEAVVESSISTTTK